MNKSKRVLVFHVGSIAKCNPVCTEEYDPQCGTDGKTYGNPCMMEYEICKSNGKIKLAYAGPCSKYF